MKIGFILYSFRDYCQTREGLDETLRRLSEIGYTHMQYSSVPVPLAEVRELMDKHGFDCLGIHDSLDAIVNHKDEVMAKLDILGTRSVALGHPGNDYWSEEGVIELAGLMDKAGKAFREKGYLLEYHNHHREFMKIGRELWLDVFYHKTKPEHVLAQLDTHWITRGGQEPFQWLNKMAGRIRILHAKDFIINSQGEPFFAEIGKGNLDWKGILAAGEAAGTGYIVVEQDLPSQERDIFASAEISFRFLKTNTPD